MKQAYMALLTQGVAIWNSQRPRLSLDMEEWHAHYTQYCEQIKEISGIWFDGELKPESFEDFLKDNGLQEPLQMEKADLREMDLRDYDLSWCDLTEARLNGADLRGANLSYCRLRRASLIGVDLRGANLSEAWLEKTQLSGAFMGKSNLPRAYGWMEHQSGIFLGDPTLDVDTWGDIVHFYHRRCAYCGGPYEIMDLFVTRSQGGTIWAGNVVPACLACQTAKEENLIPSQHPSRESSTVIASEVLERLAADLERRAHVPILDDESEQSETSTRERFSFPQAAHRHPAVSLGGGGNQPTWYELLMALAKGLQGHFTALDTNLTKLVIRLEMDGSATIICRGSRSPAGQFLFDNACCFLGDWERTFRENHSLRMVKAHCQRLLVAVRLPSNEWRSATFEPGSRHLKDGHPVPAEQEKSDLWFRLSPDVRFLDVGLLSVQSKAELVQVLRTCATHAFITLNDTRPS